MPASRDNHGRQARLIGRADLLLALSGLEVNNLYPSGPALAEALGFGVSTSAQRVAVDTQLPISETAAYSPIPTDEIELSQVASTIGVWVCTSCEPLTDNPAPQLSTATITRSAVQEKREPQPAAIKHLSFSSLLNTWDQICSGSVPGHQLDVHRAVNLCAEAKPLLALPRRVRMALPSEVVLIIDCRPQLYTLLNEQILIIQHLHQMLGESLHVVEMRENPNRFLDELKNSRSESSKQISATAIVLVLSDFDRFTHHNTDVKDDAWIRCIGQLLDRGNTVVTLGVGVAELESRVGHFGILGDTTTDENINLVMASMVRLHLAKPDRIRSLIKALGMPARMVLATENAIWNHEDRDVELPNQWSFKEGRRKHWKREYDALSVGYQQIVDREVDRWRSSLHPGHAGVEYLIDGWAGIGHGPTGDIFDRAMAVGEMGDEGRARFDSWLFAIHSIMQEVAEVYAERTDLRHLLEASQVHAATHGLSQPLGLQFLATDETTQISFHQIGPELHVSTNSTRASVWTNSGLCLHQDSQKQVRHGDQFIGQELLLQSGTHEACLTFFTLPSWATSFARDSAGLVQASHQDNVTFTYLPASASRSTGEWKLVTNLLEWAKQAGVDEYGLWAEFTVNQVTQRLRWIPPGEFQMGSPEDELERNDNEILHHVTLTEGYWLADTTCTQALWEAVMGSNPSNFKGPDRPVETVSWKEIKEFIEQLNKKVPGLQSQLPTEAQWEYAARAGSQSAFWWGSTLSAEQANYDGNLPYADGEKGQYREETVAVKEFEASPWGLYQVHGNVWEWCEDWYGAYESDAAVNPRGAESGEGRVIRGGSWCSNGGWLRAACRSYERAGQPHGKPGLPPVRRSVRGGAPMRAGTAGTGEAEPTVPAGQARVCGVLVAMIKANCQSAPVAKDSDLPSMVDTVTNQ